MRENHRNTAYIVYFGFHYRRINEYSPTDVSKANERAVNRRNNVRFNPKATVDILNQGEPPHPLDDDQKREMVQKFIEVRTLLYHLLCCELFHLNIFGFYFFLCGHL